MNTSALTLSDFDDSWDDMTPIPPGPPPEGDYRARVSRLEVLKAAGTVPCVRVTFEIVDEPFTGKSVSYLLRFANPHEAKGALQILGLGAVKPSDLELFAKFASLPFVRIRVRLRESDGEIYANVVRIEPLPNSECTPGTAKGA